MQLNLAHVTYTYPGASAPALQDISAVFPEGWTGIIGDNGSGKTTLARIAAGLLRPDSGSVSPGLFAAYCQQDSSLEPCNLEDLATNWGQEARRAKELLGVEDDWLWRHVELSGGQQKRVQIACALFARPDVLVMDEPTNDLDVAAKEMVFAALSSFKGIGILISHDRALLDGLVGQSLVFEGAKATMRPGGYSKASEQATLERDAALRSRADARREAKRLESEAQRRSVEADKQKAKRSRARLDRKDSDGRERIGRAIVSGKDGVAGKLAASMERRLERANGSLEALRVEKRYEPRLEGFGSQSKGRSVAHAKAATLRAGDFAISVPELWIDPADHVVLSGRNGTGKSLIVRHVMEAVPKGVATAYVPQEVGEAERASSLQMLHQAKPEARGRALSIVAGLNSDPDRILDGNDLSPGELRKLMLAQRLLNDPNLLILDEPTNHMDVGSIEALQRLLISFPGAVLLVTHDQALIDAVAGIRWRTTGEGGNHRLQTC